MRTSWPIEDEQEKRTRYILFIISPFISFLYSLKNIKTKSFFYIFFGLSLCAGVAFTTTSYGDEGITADAMGLDIGRYRNWFEEAAKMNTEQFLNSLDSYLEFDAGEKDFYFTTVSYLVSRLTDNYHWLFLVFAIVFTFFQLKSLKILVDHKNWGTGWFYILLFVFFTWNQIFQLNSMRFFTAAWIVVYCVFQIFLKDKKTYFILLFITPFFHASYWLISGIVSLIYIIKKREWIGIFLFILSFFSSTFFADVLSQTAKYLPDSLSYLVDIYTDKERLFTETTYGGSGFWWVRMVGDTAYKIYTNLLVLIFIINHKEINLSKTKNLYYFILFFMAFINFSMPMPVLGRRAIVIAYPIIVYIWLANFGKTKYSWLIYIFPIVWAWNILTILGYYNMVLDWTFFVSSPIYIFFKYLLLA